MMAWSSNGRLRRRGVALLVLVAILAFLGFLMGTIARQTLAHRQYLKHRELQLQADWLAAAGIELAVARLLQDPTYAGETAAIIPDSHVQIEVKNERVPADVLRITCDVRIPANDRKSVARTVSRQFRRVGNIETVRMEGVVRNSSDD